MEKIFKKSLALVLSAALCLTAFVGCLTVSAADETTTPIYEMVGAEGKAGETVTVTAKLQNIEGICAHHVKFTFAKELTVVSMHDVTRDKPVKFDTDVAEGENFQFKKSIDTNTGVTTVEDVNILNFVKSDNTYDEHTPSLTLTFSVKIADGTADGNYAVNVTATAADQGEAWVNTIDFRNSNVVVKNATEVLVDMGEPKHLLDLQSSIIIGFTLPKTIFADCNEVYAMCSKDYYSSDGTKLRKEPVKIIAEEYQKDTSKYVFYYPDVHAKEMGNDTYTTFYGVKNNGTTIYSAEHVYSIKQYASDALKIYSANSKYSKLCTVIVDMLNYGAAAQKQFNYNVANLVNADFEQYQNYATTTMPTLVNKDKTTSNEGATVELGRTLSLESTITIDATFAYDKDISNLKVKFTYNNLLNVQQTEYVTSKDFVYKNGKYYASLRMLRVPQMNDVAQFELYDGDTLISNTREFSIGSYAAIAQGLGDKYAALKDVTIAMMRFGDSASAYFGRS